MLYLWIFIKIMDSFELNKIIAAVLLTALNNNWDWKIYRPSFGQARTISIQS